MKKPGQILMVAWGCLNILPCLWSLYSIGIGDHAPGLRMLFRIDEIPEIESRVLSTVDGLGVIANAVIVAFCVLFIWTVLNAAQRKSILVLAVTVFWIQCAAYYSDGFFNSQNFWVINSSSALLILGFTLRLREIKHV